VTDQVVSTRIDWVREHCRLLQAISAEFRQTRPFDGLTSERAFISKPRQWRSC
jgi:hypothetical protein